MRLRNKITNKICDAEARDDGIYVKTNFGDGEKWHKYGLGCLGDNWEYYVEPEKPLIKDEKIRKAVRAWAEACCIELIEVTHSRKSILRAMDAITGNDEICINREIGQLLDEKVYNIDELCGEEEDD